MIKEPKETFQIFGAPYRPPKWPLMLTTTIGDVMNVEANGIRSGVVTLINIKGINVYTDEGCKFVKWSNVIEKVNQIKV